MRWVIDKKYIIWELLEILEELQELNYSIQHQFCEGNQTADIFAKLEEDDTTRRFYEDLKKWEV